MFQQFSYYKDDSILLNHVKYEDAFHHEFPLHTHDICELILLKEGDVTGIIEGKSYKLQPNSIIIFRPRLVHGIRIDSNVPYDRYNIIFDETKVANQSFQKIPKNLNIIDCNNNHLVCDLFKKLDFYHDKFTDDDFGTLVKGLIEELVFNLSITDFNHSQDPPISSNTLITTALEFINRHYTEQLTIEDICSELYISKRHLHHLFMEHLNITPKKYINSKRLMKAQNMLRTGTKAYDVYFSCGFTDYATFYRNYIQKFGHPPSRESAIEIERQIKS